LSLLFGAVAPAATQTVEQSAIANEASERVRGETAGPLVAAAS
jgi:hypothetical protein